MKRLGLLSTLGALALGLAACGDRPQVVQYKQGVYQGKPFSQPYQAPPYSGDKVAWEKQMTQRAQAQNEYNRTK
jgi:hypothetical protein